METIKIFLASSEELRNDRDHFEILVGRENQKLTKQNLFLELIRWENFIDSMNRVRLQNEYNRAVEEADIFIILYSGKVGKYTAEEFETAYKQFKDVGHPLIYTYFKVIELKNDQWKESDHKSLRNFQKKLISLGHFETKYFNIEGLELHFKNQLEILLANEFQDKISNAKDRKNEEPMEESSSKDLKNEDNKVNITNHNLPSRTYGSKLVGREEYIKKILKAIHEAPIVAIEGFSGIGKTSLALEIAYIFLHKSEIKLPLELQFNYIVWLSAKNKEQNQWVNDVLNKVAEVLEHPSISQISLENLSVKKKEVEQLLRPLDLYLQFI